MDRQRKLTALRRCLKSEPHGSGDEKSFFCQFPRPDGCGGEHHKRKLSVNIESDRWRCWVCGKGGFNLLRLLTLGGKTHPDYIDYAAEQEAGMGPKVPEKAHEQVSLPEEFRPLCVPRSTIYYQQAMGYLAERGITPDVVLTYKLGYCEDGQYAERIVIPSFDMHGALNFFTARSVWKRLGLPYLHGRFDKDIIFNELLIDWSKPVILVEGPFDAIKAGTNAITLQGKAVRKRLLKRLVEKRWKEYGF